MTMRADLLRRRSDSQLRIEGPMDVLPITAGPIRVGTPAHG